MDDIYINKIRAGDTDAFRYLVRAYKDMAFSVAISVVKEEYVAEEVVQEAFVNAYKGLSSFTHQAKFSTWFYRIVINVAFQRRKKMKTERVAFVEDYSPEVVDESLLLSLQEEEQTYYINEALRKLPANESLVLRLFYLQEESIKEVCEVTGWSESKVKVTLFRARKNMYLVLNQIYKLER